MFISIVIPAYNASLHVESALRSICEGFDQSYSWELEVIVVDDGSQDGEFLASICSLFTGVRLVSHASNRGLCAARNTGIRESRGDYVTLLDADDEFVSCWFVALLEILGEWPASANVCFTQCINDAGKRTCARPDYTGWLTAEDMVLEHFSGEYNPIFRGNYIRHAGFNDLGTHKSCGTLTYLRMARESPFWITDKVQRLYHDFVEQSITHSWTEPDKASETCHCFSTIMEEHGAFIRSVSEVKFRQMRYKVIIYLMLSRQNRDFAGWWNEFSVLALKSWFATLGLLLIGPKGARYLLVAAKRYNFLRRYG